MELGLADHAALQKALIVDSRVRAVLPRLQFSGLISNGDKSSIFLGTGIDPAEFTVKGPFMQLLAGKTLSRLPDPAAEPELILGKELAREMGAAPGSSLTLLATTTEGALNAVDVQVRGIVSTGVPEVDQRLAYVHTGTAQALLVTPRVSTLSVFLYETADTAALQAELAARHPELGVKPWWELAFYYKAVRALYDRLFGVLGAILMVLVFFAVANTMSMAVLERTRETGTLAALGSYPSELVRNFVLEALVIGTAAVALGMLLAGSLSLLLNCVDVQMPPPPGRTQGYPLLIVVSPVVYAAVAALVLITCVAAAFGAARRGVRRPIVEALAHV